MSDHTYSEELIRLHDVSMVWNGREALSDVNLTVRRGDFVAVTGPNGGGKTTLMRIILKLLHPTTGSVEYLRDGRVTDHLRIGYLPQKSLIDTKFPITTAEVIASGLAAKNLSKERRAELLERTIDTVGLRTHRSKPIGTLSGGQLQRTLLGRAIISDPRLLVLDEPLSYVDKRFEHRIYEIIGSLADAGTTIILVSHEMSTISGMATRHFLVDRTLVECTAEHHRVAGHILPHDCC